MTEYTQWAEFTLKTDAEEASTKESKRSFFTKTPDWFLEVALVASEFIKCVLNKQKSTKSIIIKNNEESQGKRNFGI